jgi:CRISPR-associated protein Cmr2
VYAGGDDMLGMVPVRTAVAAAKEVNTVFARRVRPLLPAATASTALLFFHASYPLQSAVSGVGALLREAKQEGGRPGLGVAVVRRGGERARVVLPWSIQDAGRPAVELLAELVADLRGGLSGRLAAGLERDAAALARLPQRWQDREVRRLVSRHSGRAGAGGSGLGGRTTVGPETALLTSAGWPSTGGAPTTPASVAQVARFIAQEGA